MRENIVQEKSFRFAVGVVALSRQLHAAKEFILADQLLRSGTSIGANVEEALAAQSRKDFISKMSIASKEARETLYWLRLLVEAGVLKDEVMDLHDRAQELVRILGSIVKTTRDGPRVTSQDSLV